MVAYNPRIVRNCAVDQAILSLVLAVSEQARPFYQQAAALEDNNNIRRYFLELEQLHQQAAQCVATDYISVVTDKDINQICQWYRYSYAKLKQLNRTGMAELPQQLRHQLSAFKRLSRELTQRGNAKALANLTAGLQIIADQIFLLLLSNKR